MTSSVTVTLRCLGGASHVLELPASLSAEALHSRAAAALSQAPGSFKLVHNGVALSAAGAAAAARAGLLDGLVDGAAAPVRLAQGDVLLVTPQRRAPSERLQRAAAEAAGVELEDEDERLRFQLRPNAPRWEAWLARFLKERCRAPDLALIWLFHLGPLRLLAGAAVLAGARIAAAFELGPLYILAVMTAVIFVNLGTKREGEASAYSVFNPGVRRLPGQLDADVIDEQIRRGQM